MEHCPKCRSSAVHASRSRSRWERWRKEITGKRPFRCRDCGWRGWGIDEGPSFADLQTIIVDRAAAPEPPNLGPAGLGREPVRRHEPNLDALDGAIDQR